MPTWALVRSYHAGKVQVSIGTVPNSYSNSIPKQIVKWPCINQRGSDINQEKSRSEKSMGYEMVPAPQCVVFIRCVDLHHPEMAVNHFVAQRQSQFESHKSPGSLQISQDHPRSIWGSLLGSPQHIDYPPNFGSTLHPLPGSERWDGHSSSSPRDTRRSPLFERSF